MIVRVAKGPPKFKQLKCYEKRSFVLSHLGYTSYPEYLASDEWKAIRDAALASHPHCRICEKPAKVVHHMDYDEGTLLGLWPERLAQLCRECHQTIEFRPNGEKSSVEKANNRLFYLLSITPGPSLKERKRWAKHVKLLEPKRKEQTAILRRRLQRKGEMDRPLTFADRQKQKAKERIRVGYDGSIEIHRGGSKEVRPCDIFMTGQTTWKRPEPTAAPPINRSPYGQ
jgi:hypothetical protein